MSPRYLLPELFHLVGAPIEVEGKPRLALRWILHPSLGLPRALFHVWRFDKQVPSVTVAATVRGLDTGDRLLTWAEGPAAAMILNVTVPDGATLTVRAHSGATATGHPVDIEVVTGKVDSLAILLSGTAISSITLSGVGEVDVTKIVMVPIHELAGSDGWTLVETVGLPVDKTWDGTGYPTDDQGPVGDPKSPMKAAIERVERGNADGGWPVVSDRGTAVEPFVAPDATALVDVDLLPVRDLVRELLLEVADPADHADYRTKVKTRAPRSVHGVDGSPRWQERARASEVSPLGSLLVPAGCDPFSALALGFGTTVDGPRRVAADDRGRRLATATALRSASTQPTVVILMVTVEHDVEVKMQPPWPPFGVHIKGELAAIHIEPQRTLLAAPAEVSASPPTGTAVHLDPPGHRDGRWLAAVQTSWAAPLIAAASQTRPTGYAIARAVAAEPLTIGLDKRGAGGWLPFVPAVGRGEETPTSITFTEAGIAERFPNEPATMTWAVAATDWFGRWSDWASADHDRVSVGPPAPAVHDLALVVAAGSGPSRAGSATVDVVWDWSHRSPQTITVRLLAHAEGSPPPSVAGSVLAVAGPTVADLVLDFSTATPDAPPAGVELVAEQSRGNLRTYRVTRPGFTLGFGSHPRIRVTARAQAVPRVGFPTPSAWSPDRSSMVASPVPPPAPFVPAAMAWASVPDPRGVARTTLTWTGSAPSYAVYVADETAIRRELDLPSADLEVAAADRLPALRAVSFASARNAFRRLAGPVTATSLPVELPRGSQLIHFYAVVGLSVTGVEGPLPATGNSYLAVAASTIESPEMPRLIARDRGGTVGLTIEVAETRVAVDRIALYRAPNRTRAVSVEHAGPPIAVIEASHMPRSADGLVRIDHLDASPGRRWEPVFYRAVAWAASDRSRGVFGGASLPTPAVEVVVTSSEVPTLADLRVDDVATEPAHWLVSFVSDATLVGSPRGSHVFAVQTVAADAQVHTRRVAAAALPLLAAALPGPGDQPDTIFRHHPLEPRTGRTYAWVPRTVRAVIVEIADPSGRATRQTWTAP